MHVKPRLIDPDAPIAVRMTTASAILCPGGEAVKRGGGGAYRTGRRRKSYWRLNAAEHQLTDVWMEAHVATSALDDDDGA